MSNYIPVGSQVEFKPNKGKVRIGVVEQYIGDWTYRVLLEGDPFAVELHKDSLTPCEKIPTPVSFQSKVSEPSQTERKQQSMTATATKPSAKELRKEAQALGVEGWEDMGRSELATAVKKARKAQSNGHSTTGKLKTKKAKKSKAAVPESEEVKSHKKAIAKKAKAKKVAAPAKAKAEKTVKASSDAFGISLPSGKTPKKLPAEGENPFRKSSNLFKIAKLLLKGGTRRNLAEALAKSTSLNPYTKDDESVDLNDYDKRLLLGSITMRDTYGYGIYRSGRGMDGKIKVFIPGGPNDPRSAKKSKK